MLLERLYSRVPCVLAGSVSAPNPTTEPQIPKPPKQLRKQRKPYGKTLSVKQRRVIAAYADPKSLTHNNATRSAIAAGYSPISSPQTGNRIVKSSNGERELNRIFDAAGLTTQKMAKRVRQAMDAKEERPFIHQASGNIVYSKKIASHDIRLRAIRLAAEMRGDMAPKELDVRVAVLAGRIQAARRREIDQAPASDKQSQTE